ncbi:MAG: GntR family transcriptional regulator [Actinobacteria bacterium]|nr:MAG: GntR family transcriptional regulator [Actinomycetota bacterium]
MDTTANTALYTQQGDDALVAAPAGASLAADTYEALMLAIVVGHYRLGARLGEERLARDYGVSRTPVREALVRLHVDGLVTRHPDGGWTPTVPNLAVVRELYEVRIALELGTCAANGRSWPMTRRLPTRCSCSPTRHFMCDWPRPRATASWPKCYGGSTSASARFACATS